MNPLKFLDAYQREDLHIFFGRETETKELYTKVKKSRLFILYGLSGTGKTSVVRCGLANKFDPVNCLEIYIRRETHLLQSMRKCIQEEADTFIPKRTENIEALRLLYVETLRPIFLIFDQFEELFISGSKEERDEFGHFLRQVLSENIINANILIIIREEYMGQLEQLEPYAPGIYENKQRLERMTSSSVLGVVKKILEYGKIDYHDPTIPQSIVENAEVKNNLIELPYLQVYLDRLFKIVRPTKSTAAITITNDHLHKVGKLEELLGDFLEKQLAIISAKEKDRDTEFGWRILKKLITPEATKKLLSVSNLLSDVFDQGELNDANERKLESYLFHLRDSRIIRMMGDDQLEIAHDTLGTEIAKKRTPEELKILESERIVRSKYLSLRTRLKDDLTDEQIRYIQPNELKLKLEPEERKFIRDSIRRNRLKKTFIKIIATSAISLLLALTLWAMDERNKAERARTSADSARTLAEEARIIAELQKARADTSARTAESISRSLEVRSKELEEAVAMADESAALAKDNARKAKESEKDAVKSQTAAIAASEHARDRELFAKRERNKTESINLALQSTLENDSVERTVKALKAYYLNANFNDKHWTPEIATALIYSNPFKSVRALAPVTSPLADIQNLGGTTIAISDLGKFQTIDLRKGGGEMVFDTEDFYYLNNSAQFDSAKHELLVIDKRKTIYQFSVNNASFHLMNKKRNEISDSLLLVKGEYVLTGRGILKRENDGYTQILKFKDGQYGNHLTVSERRKTLAAGTTNGWLYVLRPEETPYAMGQFQNPSTPIIDIAFDERAEFIVTGGTDSRFRLAQISLMKEKLPVEWKFKTWVTALLFVADKRVLIGTADGKLFLFDYDQDRLAKDCCEKLKTQLRLQKRSITDSLVVRNCLDNWL